jgi:5-methylcytosine-specific restriction enzyme B
VLNATLFTGWTPQEKQMQTKTIMDLAEALATYDRKSHREYVGLGEAEREELLRRFPLTGWSTMGLEKYALGQSSSESTYCGWLEFRSSHLGSIAGGSAKKLLIYKRKSGDGWYFDPAYSSFGAAWEAVRAAFVRAFELADAGDWNAVDQLKPIWAGPALRVKTLHVYFPEHILPVAARPHLLHFLKRLGAYTPELESAERIALNRALAKAVFAVPQFEGWTTNEVERFLYWWSDPKDTRKVLKISPGEDAKYWEDCLQSGCIRVGWDAVGDLREFAGKEEFEEEFRKQFEHLYNNHLPTIRKKGNELWQIAGLAEGDIVVANKGTSRVLAIGEVLAPGYEWKPGLPEFCHTVRVRWDTSFEQEISAQKRWALVTVANVPSDLYQALLKKSGKSPAANRAEPAAVTEPLYTAIADALERKGQLILYGPPGTGKTFITRRFSVWWMLMHCSEDANATLASPELFDAAERRFTTGVSARRVWWVVANPKEWKWDILFNKESEVFRRRRIQRHFSMIRPGDLVVGYQATPDKRVVALAKVSRVGSQMSSDNLGFEVIPVRQVSSGPTWEELLARPKLKNSEPVRFNNQGTLFSLTPQEVEELADLIGEKDSDSATLLTNETLGSLIWTTFHPTYAYEDFVEGLRPFDAGEGRVGLRLEDGLFKRLCRAADAKPEQRFLLIIDEINRANVSKVFGELITVLEQDKRGLPVVLPQSKESFSVPPNLYILATMNTADRSIRLLDSALRRRFAFLELMPDSRKLQGAAVGGLALDELMETLNARIAKHVGREKQLGHSYFLDRGQPVTDPDQFAQRFHQEILPVLQEYCYDDFSALTNYLGSTLVDAEEQQFNGDLLNDPNELIAALIQMVAEDKSA